MSLLKVSKVNVFYGLLHILHDVSIEVESGEIVTLLGPNGAGKTTLFRTICGLLQPRSGEIWFKGERIDKYKPSQIVRRGISIVPEGRQLIPTLTVLENLELGAYLSDARKKKNDSLEYVYMLFPVLKERRKQIASTLSGGEQQMLAIARALMSRPTLLMLDEPSSGLMPRLLSTLFDAIRKINRQGVTILLIEQNVYEALQVADKGYVIENGRIVMQGKKEELLNDPHIKEAYLGLL